MNEKQLSQIIDIFSQVMGIPKNMIDDSIAYNSHPSWDSLRHLELASSLETALNIEFETDDLISMVTFSSVKTICSKYLE
ncbi:MAG: phosphopantetheine-binding protein [Candidatus Cloacimonetes bacterium]|nr:phosphopantetheine-binding protein [Candidatus Cloacimonadota bacterium]